MPIQSFEIADAKAGSSAGSHASRVLDANQPQRGKTLMRHKLHVGGRAKMVLLFTLWLVTMLSSCSFSDEDPMGACYYEEYGTVFGSSTKYCYNHTYESVCLDGLHDSPEFVAGECCQEGAGYKILNPEDCHER